MTSCQRMIVSCSRINQKYLLSGDWCDMLNHWSVFSIYWCYYESVFVRPRMSTRMNQKHHKNNSRNNVESLRRLVLMNAWPNGWQISFSVKSIQRKAKSDKRPSCLNCKCNARLNQTMIWISDRYIFVRPRNCILNCRMTNHKSWYNDDWKILTSTRKYQSVSFSILWFSRWKIHKSEK